MHSRSSPLALPAFFVLTFALFAGIAPRFATAANVENLLAGYSFMAMLAIGQAFPIMLRGIDLSVGAVVALAGMVAFDLVLIAQMPGYLVLPIVLVVATAAGAVNGVLIVWLRLQPFIATLATLAAYRGLVFFISGRQLVPSLSTAAIEDRWILSLETYLEIGTLPGLPDGPAFPAIPLSFLAVAVMLAMAQGLLLFTRFGRELYTIGGNEEAARLAGIRVGRGVVVAYAISGLCAGIAGLFLVARLTTATEAMGSGMELTAIAAAVIGGVSLQGGTGSAWGPVVGAFLLGVILIGLTLLGVPQFVQQILTGGVLLAAIAHDRFLVLRRQRMLLRPGEGLA